MAAPANQTADTADQLMRLTVQDKLSGAPLFDKIWKWKQDQKSPGSMSSLVQFFFQFSRELDKGVRDSQSEICFAAAWCLCSHRHCFAMRRRSARLYLTAQKKSTLAPAHRPGCLMGPPPRPLTHYKERRRGGYAGSMGTAVRAVTKRVTLFEWYRTDVR